MASIRLQIALIGALVTGALVACSGEEAPDPQRGSSSSGGSPTVAPWRADANGTTLFDHVAEEARRRAAAPYRAPDHEVVVSAGDFSYAEYRDIRFRPERALWRGSSPFEVQLFHPGGASDVPVRIHLVEDGESRLLDFDPALFTYGDVVGEAVAGLPPEVGFAGFRVLTTMNEPTKMDEVAAFLGASYFRVVGPGQVYGLSTRGLAVDIAEAGGEEFPDFVAYWLVRPEPGDEAMTFYGLLDSPSAAGAYRFELRPGQAGTDGDGPSGDAPGAAGSGAAAPGSPAPGAVAPGSAASGTTVDVTARLHFRTDVAKVGVAPLTSMYLHGLTLPGGHDDIRPRVHDSEGLSMLTAGGEWIWRPLTNGSGVRVTSLRDVDPQGFGLVQRSRDFDEYLDLEALYHRRPSLWVDIDDAWGGGGVELLEIPTTSEFNDNVVAYWVPDEDPRAGEERTYRYRLVTFDTDIGEGAGTATVARVVRTRIGWDALPGAADPPPRSRRRVVVDFAGGPLASVGADEPVTASVSTSSGTISDVRVERLPDDGRRVTFALEPDDERGADMRLFLVLGDSVVSETWSYLWEPSLVH